MKFLELEDIRGNRVAINADAIDVIKEIKDSDTTVIFTRNSQVEIQGKSSNLIDLILGQDEDTDEDNTLTLPTR